MISWLVFLSITNKVTKSEKTSVSSFIVSNEEIFTDNTFLTFENFYSNNDDIVLRTLKNQINLNIGKIYQIDYTFSAIIESEYGQILSITNNISNINALGVFNTNNNLNNVSSISGSYLVNAKTTDVNLQFKYNGSKVENLHGNIIIKEIN